ncbi:rhomboid family intramembrane serine protease [Halorubrum sp. PV6]|uniref:rhomboid family intramembrane serine protease n=1 Tax=Halorubrum sp. PV6 TaxID=634157 RepID=UPI001446D897|nr:rhomboid family intramembrane serine protease [Halorubrum sp. PV6]
MTPLLAILMGGVLLVEIQVLAHSSSLFEYLFVASGGVSPGLLLGPVSHGNFRHYLSNIGLLLLIGWPMEDRLSNKAFLGFILLAAYLPTYLQIVYSVATTGSAGTLGFSGAVYAFPPALLGIVLQEVRATENGLGTFGLVALGVTAAIPLAMLGYLDLVSGLPSAKVTHSVGYVLGLAYGFLAIGLGRR